MSLSESASAQVQAILQAAEASAEQITADAEADAERIRSEARQAKRDDLTGVMAAVAALRKNLDALEQRLAGLTGDPVAPSEPVAPAETAKTTRAPKAPPAVAKQEPAKARKESDPEADAEGARLIALNMALNGESREAADRYLAENFDLGDRGALLDEVYSSLEG